MIDMRTPTSITMTWSVPTFIGGSNVTSYQLYRDAGDASGIYSLAYFGSSPSVTLNSLTNGRTYRFYAVAVNGVGAGVRTNIVSADMRCTPRALVAAPYKVSGSPWDATLAWPESADDCGAAVLSYRVYRNGVLLYPLSNSFQVQPSVDMSSMSTDAVSVSLTPENDGMLWVIIVANSDPLRPPTSSAQQIKLASGAIGRPTCQSSSMPVSGGILLILTLYGCGLQSGSSYGLFAYVESGSGLEYDGTLFGPLFFRRAHGFQ